ncbi:hypothetical protein H4R21_002195, partial [Coemansia helicoidea]
MDGGAAMGLFGAVPEDIVLLILARLDPRSLDAAGQVCRFWRGIVSNDRSWQRALALTLGRRPFQRLQPGRMPSTRVDAPGWLCSGRAAAATWRGEYVDRLALHKLWASAHASHQRRIEFNPRASTIDGLVVSEKHGWALAVSKTGRGAVRCLPQSGKVFAREDNTSDIVFATGMGETVDVGALATRIDRILWGLDDGRSTVTHLTRGGGLRARVVAEQRMRARVTAIAGPFDQLAQVHHDWGGSAAHCGADDLVASATAGGSVLVWSATTGRTHRVLHGARDVRLTQVAWADGGRYVVAAAEDEDAVFVWDLAAPGSAAPAALVETFARVGRLRPEPCEFADGSQPPSAVFALPKGKSASAARLVLLAGDPHGDSFIVATCAGGAARMSVTGDVLAAFELAPAGAESAVAVTAATWMVDVAPAQQAGQWGSGGGATPTHSPSTTSLCLDSTQAAHGVARGKEKRLLVVGDAGGGVWMFDGDGHGAVPALQRWPRLHRHAVAAVTANAAIAVSAGCDGQMHVLDPLSGRVLCADRCRSGRRSDASGGQIDPWFWSVHPALRGPRTPFEVAAAQQLAGRPADWWAGHPPERLPTAVTEVRAGYGWIVAANCMHIHAAFAGVPG